MFTHINWLLKSMNRFPSGVQKYTPLARATAIGSTFDCADHSNSVCFRDSAIISSPVIDLNVSVAILVPLRTQNHKGHKEHKGQDILLCDLGALCGSCIRAVHPCRSFVV